MNFGQALETIKKGGKIQRAGWNGKGMHVALQPGFPDGVPANENASKALGVPVGTIIIHQPYMVIKNVNGSLSTWVPSVNDCLAEDWQEVELAK